jgi:hypothetical protein
MKKILVLLSVFCIALSTIATPWGIKKSKVHYPAWDKPLQGNKTFESITINWYTPEYYYADYWWPGQPEGYYFFLDLTGVQEGTWELSIDIGTTINGVTSMKTFIFIVPPSAPYNFHYHVLEMISQLSPGETIPWDTDMNINHWWVVS